MKKLKQLRWLALAVWLMTGFGLQTMAQEVDDLQEYLDQLVAEQAAVQSAGQSRQSVQRGETVTIPVGLTEVDLSKFSSSQNRTTALEVKSDVKLINGTISAASDFSDEILVKVSGGVTVMLAASAAIEANFKREFNQANFAAVAIFGGSTFYQYGDITSATIKKPSNIASRTTRGVIPDPFDGHLPDLTKEIKAYAIYLDSAVDTYIYKSGKVDGTICNPNGGTVTNSSQQQGTYDWSVGLGGDFATINAAMADSRVKEGDVLQVLKGSYITETQHVTKAVTIQGNGYKSVENGIFNGALYIDADGVTVKSLYVSDYINLRNENAVIERCRTASIRGVADYDTDNATIRGCFVTGMVCGDSQSPAYYWNIHNNIILGPVAYLSKATLNHNAIVFSSDGLVFLVNPLVYEVSDSKFANNIVFAPNKQASFSSDVLGSATQFEYNIHTNSSNPSGYSTNIYGYETIGKLFTCSGKAGTEEYYQTAAGSPAKGYANDGGDCGPWSGAFPYKLNGGDDSQGGGGDDPIPGDDWQVERQRERHREHKAAFGINRRLPFFDNRCHGSRLLHMNLQERGEPFFHLDRMNQRNLQKRSLHGIGIEFRHRHARFYLGTLHDVFPCEHTISINLDNLQITEFQRIESLYIEPEMPKGHAHGGKQQTENPATTPKPGAGMAHAGLHLLRPGALALFLVQADSTA